ncbi:hypothetical protein LZ31DRAFT_218070 [Colletotrichum somersetense]|nr:hypothetical protein LZ31DRAFT_218070 [Colletotrichum somersetense]
MIPSYFSCPFTYLFLLAGTCKLGRETKTSVKDGWMDGKGSSTTRRGDVICPSPRSFWCVCVCVCVCVYLTSYLSMYGRHSLPRHGFSFLTPSSPALVYFFFFFFFSSSFSPSHPLFTLSSHSFTAPTFFVPKA